jgi:hypothetical protein
MSYQVVISSKLADNNPGLCPIKGQLLGPYSQIRAQDQFPSLTLFTTVEQFPDINGLCDVASCWIYLRYTYP